MRFALLTAMLGLVVSSAVSFIAQVVGDPTTTTTVVSGGATGVAAAGLFYIAKSIIDGKLIARDVAIETEQLKQRGDRLEKIADRALKRETTLVQLVRAVSRKLDG